MKLLCAADLHLGRGSSRLPDDAGTARFASARAFDRLVELARHQQVDAVLLAGDLVDRDNRFFEAFGPLQRGLGALHRAGIPTIAVTGNHDWDVLPSLATQFSDDAEKFTFTLLGAGGRWQRHTLRDSQGRPLVHIDGWSFTAEHVHVSPMEAYDLQPPDDAPLVGMVHGDLDQPASRYGPLASARLSQCGAAAWVLGHVHQPMIRHTPGAGCVVMYPGSPQALDPGETGMHGAVLLEVEPGRAARATRVALSTARYERFAVSLEDCDDAADVRPRIIAAVSDKAADFARTDTAAQLLSVRLELTGRTTLAGELMAQLGNVDDLRATAGTLEAVVEKITDATLPSVDLAELALGRNPVATLAGWLMQLDAPDAQPTPELAALLESAEQAATDVYRLPHYQNIDEQTEGGVDSPESVAPSALARQSVREQALALLHELRGPCGPGG